jgi:hypothetical protein
MSHIPVLGEGRYVLIVKRGETALLLALSHFLEAIDNVNVIWDRRVSERRVGQEVPHAERREADRRQTSPLAILTASRPGVPLS